MPRTSFGCSTAPNRRRAGSRGRLRGLALGALALTLAGPYAAFASTLRASADAGAISTPTPTPSTTPDRIHRATEIASPAIVLVDESTTGYVVDRSDGSRHGPFTVGGLGTGFFVGSGGYIVTAGHIAARQDDELKRDLLSAFIAQEDGCGSLDDCATAIAESIDGYDARTELADHTSTLHVVTQAERGFDQGQLRTAGREAKLVTGSADTERDVALIRIDGSNEPVLTLGDTSSAAQRTPVGLLGYPARTLKPKGQQTSTTPTITFGKVTGRRSPSDGREIAPQANLVATDAPQEEGNSGGPGVDQSGDVLGIVSFGVRNVQGGFLISAVDIRDLVERAGVHNDLGDIDHLWRDGLTAFDQHHYRDAEADFQRCVSLNTAQVGCADYEKRAKAMVGQDTGSTGSSAAVPLPQWLPGAIVFGILALAVAVIVVLRRRRPAPPVPGWAYGPPPAGWPAGRPASPWAFPSPPASPWAPPSPPVASRWGPPVEPPPAAPAAPAPPPPARPAPWERASSEESVTARFCSSCGMAMHGLVSCPRCGHIPLPSA